MSFYPTCRKVLKKKRKEKQKFLLDCAVGAMISSRETKNQKSDLQESQVSVRKIGAVQS